MRAARKCGPIRGMHSIRFSSMRSRRLLRNPRQNQLKQQISPVPPIESESIFVQVVLQIFRAHVVVYSADSTLHQAPESFNGLSVNIARDVNLRAVPDTLVDIAFRLQAIIGHVIVGKDGARRQNIFFRQTVESFLGCIGSDTRNNSANSSFTIALNHTNDGNLVTAIRRTPLPTAPLSAVVHLIHLNRRTLQLQTVLGQETPNLAEHAPRCFVGDASLPLNLLCGNSATSRTHEIHCVEPSFERSGALLENSSRERVDVVSARLAGIGGAASHAVMLLLDTALLTLSDAIRPALLFDVLKAGIIIRELGIKIRHCVAQVSRDTLLRFHGRLNCSQATRYRTCCQGIIAFYK